MKKFLMLLAITLLATSCSKGKTTDDPSKVDFDVEFHRGGRNDRPENTLYSYQYAIESGATTIECDMQLLESGEIILSHEPLEDPNMMFDLTTNQYVPNIDPNYRKDLREMTASEIKNKYNVAKINKDTSYYQEHGKTQKTPESAQIPTVEELFDMVKNCGRKVHINIETKIYHTPKVEPRAQFNDDEITNIENYTQRFIDIFYEKLMKSGLSKDQITLQSFDWRALVYMKLKDKDITTSALSSSQPPYWGVDDYLRPGEEGGSPYLNCSPYFSYDFDDPIFNKKPVNIIKKLNDDYKKLFDVNYNVIDIFSPYCIELFEDETKIAHDNGIKVLPWNANDDKEISRMIDLGVEGIISDNGPLLREVALRKGKTLFSPFTMEDKTYHL